MNGNTKVKVERTQLIDALKARQVTIEKRHKAEVATLQDRRKKAGAAQAAKLRRIADGLDKGVWPSRTTVYIDSAPVAGGSDTTSIARAIKMLGLSAEPATIVITAEDYGKYL